MTGGEDTAERRLRQALANARLLADEMARRDTGGLWTQTVAIRTEFAAVQRSVAVPSGDDAASRHHRTAVVCWDMGHNPAGRAMVLADLHLESTAVDLVGPLWSRFGDEVWAPIEDGGYSTVTFTCDRLADFAAKAYAVATHRTYDLVHICKPRFPGLVLGAMIARASNCPIIVDVDDDELAFFADAGELDTASLDLDGLHEPTEEVGTAHGVALAREAGVRTVSNVELKREYGGIMVRHARSETTFDPSVVSRDAGRDRLGARPDDFVVLFVGTPRPHKGLDIVVDSLRRLDDRFVLHVVGVADQAAFDEELDTDGVRVVTHRPTPITVLPELLAAADAIALMQHLDDPITAFQIPSKISDGLSMGLPVIVTEAPPLRDLTDHGLLRADDAGELAAHLERLAGGEPPGAARTRREAFLSEFSVEVNAARVRLAESEAITTHEADTHDLVSGTLDLARQAYVNERRRERPDLFGETDPQRADGVDIVVFWKQNDTGLYGRRSDMLTKYLAADPRVRRVLHLDAPLSTERAARAAQRRTESDADHEPLLSRVLLDRRLGIIESGAVHHRTFLYTDGNSSDPMTGEALPPLEGFADFVRAEMTKLEMEPERALAWVCPTVFDFPDVQRKLGFRAVVSDVIDDQRAFKHPREEAERIDRHYREVLGLSDRVFTNCQPNAEAFGTYSPGMVVVPNGAETNAFTPARSAPTGDERPVIVYVGEMSDRLDWDLLNDVALLRPDYRFLLVGAARVGGDAHDLAARHDNVELAGIVAYAAVPDLLAEVDVGIVPHLSGPMTQGMNPLKVYNYYAAGLPIVATPIANLGDLADFVRVAEDADGFALAIDEGIEQRRSGSVTRDEDVLRSIDWSTRAATILDRLERDGILQG